MLNQETTVRFQSSGDRLVVSLIGDVDHHSAYSVRQAIDTEMFSVRPSALVLDLSNVTFMDSSGLGLILGRLNKASEIDAELRIENPSGQIEKILELAGIGRLIKIERNENHEKDSGQ